MIYGDLGIYDIIIFAGIAAFLIYRLKNVLGKRGGFEKNTIQTDLVSEKTSNTPKEIPRLKDSETKLSAAYEAMPGFDHKIFLEGVKFAFETIINAFNNSDKKTLKNLLTKEVFLSFEKAIDEGNNNPSFQFYSLVVDGVENVFVESGFVNITLKITSEQFKDSDETTITKKQDNWTFQKGLKSKSPIWVLSST